MNKDKQKFRIVKWVMLSLSVFLNAAIITYSCLNEETTNKWTWALTNVFTKFINSFTSSNTQKIPLESIECNFSNEESYVYNYLPGYKVEEIPLGSAKQIECSFSPSDASDQYVTYTAQPADIVTLNQTGSVLSVVGMKVGECVITAKSSDGDFESSVNVKIVNTIAPTSYEISLDNSEISLGTTQTINFDIDGGCLGHNELINFRYFDTRLLKFETSNESVATVDSNGVIKPIATGSATIKVSNGDYFKSVSVNVVSGTSPASFTNLNISGDNFCYANDMILDQSSKKNHHQLTIKDQNVELDPKDFVWESSNELLAKVDRYGVVRGFRKTSVDDQAVTIKATSKTTGQEASFDMVVKEQLPIDMYYKFTIGGKDIWNPAEYSFSVGDDVSVVFVFSSPKPQNKTVIAESSDESVVSLTNEGDRVIVHALKEGTSTVTFTSVVNPELVIKAKFTILKAGAISTSGMESATTYIRKIVGHALLFAVCQVFTFLAFYMFLYNKKIWFISALSVGEGLLLAGLSELIQYFEPSRTGSFIDALIDFAGVIIGAAITFFAIFIRQKIKQSKNKDE